MAKAGRKDKYESHIKPYLDRIPNWRKQGMTEEQIYTKLGVGKTAFNKYKKDFAELTTALKKGKAELVEEIENSMYKKAKGYEYEEVKTYVSKDEKGKQITRVEKTVKHIAGDATAQIFSLKNLCPERWKDKTQHEITTPEDIKEIHKSLHEALFSE